MGIRIRSHAMRFADKLKNLLESRRIDAPELSRLLEEKYGKKISSQTVYNYINKPDVQPRLDVAMAISREFGVSIDYLADDSQDEPPAPPKAEMSELEREVLAAFRESGIRARTAIEMFSARRPLRPDVDP